MIFRLFSYLLTGRLRYFLFLCLFGSIFWLGSAQTVYQRIQLNGQIIGKLSKSDQVILQIYEVIENEDSLILHLIQNISIKSARQKAIFSTLLKTKKAYLLEYRNKHIFKSHFLDLSANTSDKSINITLNLNKSGNRYRLMNFLTKDSITGKDVENVKITFEWQLKKITYKHVASNKIGLATVLIPYNLNSYKLAAYKEGYDKYYKTVDLNSTNRIIYLKPEIVSFQIKKTFILEGLKFEINSLKFIKTGESLYTLNKLIHFLKTNPKVKAYITCHTDSRGDDNYNLLLSQKRANYIKEYMIGQGVKVTQTDAKGLGETQILNHCVNGVRCSNKDRTKKIDALRLNFIIIESTQRLKTLKVGCFICPFLN